MAMFSSSQESHQHSLEVLNQLYDHDDFMDSISSIADMGCGAGHDIIWWAKLQTRDEVPVNHNYRCLAIDQNIKQFDYSRPTNLRLVEADFDSPVLSTPVDVIWSHDSLQYAENPAATLRNWNRMLTPGGACIIMVPRTVNIDLNRWSTVTHPGQVFSFTITNLIYMLAAAGFDCRDGMFMKKPNDPWLYAMVYRSEHAPVKTTETNWYELKDKRLLPESFDRSIQRFGYARQQDLVTRWLDQSITDWSMVT